MKELRTTILIILVVLLILTNNIFGSRVKWRGSGNWGLDNRYILLFNSNNVENVTGKVIGVEKFIPIKGMSHGIALVIQTENEIIYIHLGPSWYIENQDIKIGPNEIVKVRGTRINFNGKPSIIASQVKKGDKVLIIRNRNNLPVWIGWNQK